METKRNTTKGSQENWAEKNADVGLKKKTEKQIK